MRKGNRTDWLEHHVEALRWDLDALRDRLQHTCAHRTFTWHGTTADSPLGQGPQTPGRHCFICYACGKRFEPTHAEAEASPRFRAILEACGVLEPEAEKGVEAGQRMAEAMCAWANAHRAPAAQPFTVTDFVPQTCPG